MSPEEKRFNDKVRVCIDSFFGLFKNNKLKRKLDKQTFFVRIIIGFLIFLFWMVAYFTPTPLATFILVFWLVVLFGIKKVKKNCFVLYFKLKINKMIYFFYFWFISKKNSFKDTRYNFKNNFLRKLEKTRAKKVNGDRK